MHNEDVTALSAKPLCLSYGVSDNYSKDFERIAADCDAESALAFDALVSSLVPAEIAAVHHRYLHAVFRFPRDNYAELLLSARCHLADLMNSRGMY